jgi:hypothetical protein
MDRSSSATTGLIERLKSSLERLKGIEHGADALIMKVTGPTTKDAGKSEPRDAVSLDRIVVEIENRTSNVADKLQHVLKALGG